MPAAALVGMVGRRGVGGSIAAAPAPVIQVVLGAAPPLAARKLRSVADPAGVKGTLAFLSRLDRRGCALLAASVRARTWSKFSASLPWRSEVTSA